MKKLFLMTAMLSCFLILGCDTCPTKDCPSEDVVYEAFLPGIPFPMRARIPKGFFNEENRDKVGGWTSMKDYMKETGGDSNNAGKDI